MYLLDTNHLSRLLARDPQLMSRLATLGGVAVATCAIVRGELIFMAAKSEQRTANMARVESLLSSMPVHPVDATAATWYGTFKAARLTDLAPRNGPSVDGQPWCR